MSFNHDQEVFPEVEQLNDWVNNAKIPDLIEAPEHEEEISGFCPCNCIIATISAIGGCLLAGLAGYWAFDEEFGNQFQDFFHMFPNLL